MIFGESYLVVDDKKYKHVDMTVSQMRGIYF